MASTYTTNIRLEKQGDGENPNSWGTILNQNVIDLIDEAIGGYQVVSVSSTGITLSTADGTSDQARNASLEFAGTLTANVTITIPSVEKTYFIHENTTGSFAVQIKTAAGSAYTLTQQDNTMIACDGTDIYALEHPTSVSAFTINTLTATSISTSVLSSSIITVDTSATFQQVSVDGALTVVGATTLNSTVSVGAAAIGVLVSSNATGDTTLNLQNGNFFKLTLTGNTSITTPTNISPGQSGIIYLIQDGTGGRTVSFSDVWNFPSGVTVTPTSVADSVDLISYFVRGVSAIDVASALDFK